MFLQPAFQGKRFFVDQSNVCFIKNCPTRLISCDVVCFDHENMLFDAKSMHWNPLTAETDLFVRFGFVFSVIRLRWFKPAAQRTKAAQTELRPRACNPAVSKI